MEFSKIQTSLLLPSSLLHSSSKKSRLNKVVQNKVMCVFFVRREVIIQQKKEEKRRGLAKQEERRAASLKSTQNGARGRTGRVGIVFVAHHLLTFKKTFVVLVHIASRVRVFLFLFLFICDFYVIISRGLKALSNFCATSSNHAWSTLVNPLCRSAETTRSLLSPIATQQIAWLF